MTMTKEEKKKILLFLKNNVENNQLVSDYYEKD